MIVGCYTLDLYCDHPDHERLTDLMVPAQFTAEHGSACRAEARRAGWRLNLETCVALCPKHSGKRKS